MERFVEHSELTPQTVGSIVVRRLPRQYRHDFWMGTGIVPSLTNVVGGVRNPVAAVSDVSRVETSTNATVWVFEHETSVKQSFW